jgi:hypothetical protein
MQRVIPLLLVILFGSVSGAAAQTPYYQGKTITIITAAKPATCTTLTRA